jgi:hypothetical protein
MASAMAALGNLASREIRALWLVWLLSLNGAGDTVGVPSVVSFVGYFWFWTRGNAAFTLASWLAQYSL